jgi:hypothetical protein
MAQAQPLWRQAFDRFERVAGKRVEELVDSDGFAVAAGIALRVQRDISDRSERASRRLLHVLNLPAGSDVKRLLCHIASLEREVRDLRKEVADVLPPETLHALELRNRGRAV